MQIGEDGGSLRVSSKPAAGVAGLDECTGVSVASGTFRVFD